MHLSSRRNEYRVVDDWYEAQYQSQSAKHHGNNTTDRKGLTRLMPSGLSRSNRTGLRNGLLIGSRGTDERTASCARNTGIVGGFGFPIGEQPDVVLMDIAMPDVDGIEATRRLQSLPHAPHVLILTSLSPSSTVERAVEAGAEGFVSKTDAPDDIIRRVLGVCAGAPQFNTASQKQLIDDLSESQPRSRRDAARELLGALPDREREAVMLAAEGYTNAEIDSRMFISERTAKAHLSSAADKLNMGRVQMARLVERADLPARL